jgi:hypothetical protein
MSWPSLVCRTGRANAVLRTVHRSSRTIDRESGDGLCSTVSLPAWRRPGGSDMGPQDAGLVGTPYFWTGIAATVALWGAVMVALYF